MLLEGIMLLILRVLLHGILLYSKTQEQPASNYSCYHLKRENSHIYVNSLLRNYTKKVDYT